MLPLYGGLARVQIIICERAPPPAAPQDHLLIAGFTSQRRRGIDQQPQNDRPIVAGKLNQIGLGDEAAEFDQLTRTVAALHLPFPRVMPRRLSLKSVASLYRPPVRAPCCSQRFYEHRRRYRERRRRRFCATPPFVQCLR